MNALRTVLSILAALMTAGLAFVPKAIGCVYDASNYVVDCSHSILPLWLALAIIFTLIVGNLLLKAYASPNASFWVNMFAKLVPVTWSGKPGTVTPSQVATDLNAPSAYPPPNRG